MEITLKQTLGPKQPISLLSRLSANVNGTMFHNILFLQCASLPSSTTLLSSGIFSNTCTYGAPYRNNRTTPPATHRGRPIPPSHLPIILSRTSPERAGNNPARLKSCLFAPYTTDNDSSPVRAPVRPGVSLVCRGISRKCTNSRAAFPKFTTSPQLPQGLIFLSLC